MTFQAPCKSFVCSVCQLQKQRGSQPSGSQRGGGDRAFPRFISGIVTTELSHSESDVPKYIRSEGGGSSVVLMRPLRLRPAQCKCYQAVAQPWSAESRSELRGHKSKTTCADFCPFLLIVFPPTASEEGGELGSGACPAESSCLPVFTTLDLYFPKPFRHLFIEDSLGSMNI